MLCGDYEIMRLNVGELRRRVVRSEPGAPGSSSLHQNDVGPEKNGVFSSFSSLSEPWVRQFVQD